MTAPAIPRQRVTCPNPACGAVLRGFGDICRKPECLKADIADEVIADLWSEVRDDDE